MFRLVPRFLPLSYQFVVRTTLNEVVSVISGTGAAICTATLLEYTQQDAEPQNKNLYNSCSSAMRR
jgi:hypothetical protein